MANSQLPFHIIRDIMLNLPLKSLLRFKLVSSQWHHEITSQNFTRTQLRKHQKKVSSFLINTRHIMENRHAKTYYLDNNPLEVAGLRPFELRLPIDLHSESLTSLNICDGILCSTFNYYSKIFLWNPITNWYKIVPLDRSERIYDLGFGYNPSDDDYKLVIFVEEYKDIYIEIFSLKSCAWKRVCSISRDDFCYKNFLYKPVYITGTLNWCQIHDFEDDELYVFRLDLVEEKLIKIRMPKPSSQCFTRPLSAFTSYRNMLCMIWGRRKDGLSHEMCGHEIWVMKAGNNWEKLWDISIDLGLPICCTHEGVVFLTRENFFIHDNEEGSVKSIKVHELDSYNDRNIGYVGSLVTPSVAEKLSVDSFGNDSKLYTSLVSSIENGTSL